MALLDDPGLLALLPDPVVVLDLEGHVVWANDAAAHFSGFELDAWRGRSVFDLLHPDDHAVTLAAFASVPGQDAGLGSLIDVRVQDANGRWRPCELRGRYLDEIDRVIVAFRNTEDRQALELGQGDHERLRALVHHARALLVSLDEEGAIRSANAELSRMLGVDGADVIGLSFDQLLVPDDRPAFRDTIHSRRAISQLELRAMHAEGHPVYLDISIADLREDAVQSGFTVCATDITDLKTTQRALRHMAEHDALTGLLNRRALLAKLDDIVGDGYLHEIVILFCDLDGFKPVNDRFGHAAGDQVLIEVARRLERSVRPGDLVGRLGGDEFVVVLPRMDPGQADDIIVEIRRALTAPIVAADQVVEVDVSIGSATTGDSPTATRLLAAADDAMYAVKKTRAHA